MWSLLSNQNFMIMTPTLHCQRQSFTITKNCTFLDYHFCFNISSVYFLHSFHIDWETYDINQETLMAICTDTCQGGTFHKITISNAAVASCSLITVITASLVISAGSLSAVCHHGVVMMSPMSGSPSQRAQEQRRKASSCSQSEYQKLTTSVAAQLWL